MVLPIYNLGEYSGQVMKKNKINMLSRNETKRNIAYVDDLIINKKYVLKMSLENIRAKKILFRISS
jgi:hypothetical protein